MLPVIVIIGRPNVGKSTLFNRLTRTRDALVGNMPGLTRDRQYGEGLSGNQPYIIVDTGGVQADWIELSKLQKTVTGETVEGLMAKQAWQAAKEADAILFLVDARAGLTPVDRDIAQMLREHGKKVYLVVNKIDGLDEEEALTDFYALGLGAAYPIAAEHGTGISELIEYIVQGIVEAKNPESPSPEDAMILAEGEQKDAIKVAFVGRPNVGKSTLINRILGEERVVVYDLPGTTRDSIFVNFKRQEQNYTLIDTAGVRRKSRVHESIEKFSVIKTLQAIAASDVVVMMIDARENLVEHDMWLLGFIIEAGKSLVIAVNKWDNLPQEQRTAVNDELERRLAFVDFAKIHFISALHGSGVGNLFLSINQAYQSATRKLDTSELTKILQKAIETHQPPLVKGRRIKLRYAHAGGRQPPLIVIHGNQVQSISADYRRYLERAFRKALNLSGTPVRIEFKGGDNPYAKEKRKT